MGDRSFYFFRGLGAGYIAIAVNIAYTGASIPLALHYLGKEQFGLWALAQQIAGYLMLLDLGVSSAVSRFSADRKDEVNSGSYGSLLLTGAIVFASQGLLIAVGGGVFSFFAPTLFSIPPHLSADFTNVLLIIIFLAGLSVVSRSIGSPLWAFQRMDVAYGLSTFNLLTSFIVLWFGFHQGWGIYSFAFAGIPGVIVSPILTFWFCRRNHYYPSTGFWGRPNWTYLRQIFLFCQDVLWITIGSQLVNASQIMILSRVAGLDVAATFSVGTKLFNMGQLLTGKVIDSSGPALTELFVRGDISRFSLRFAHAVSITAFVATVGATALIALNAPFVSLWSSGAVHWNLSCDALLAGLLIATSITRCLIGVFGLAGSFRPVRHIYFAEGCVFIMAAIPAAAHFGIIGILGSSLIVHLMIAGILGYLAAEKALGAVKPIIPHLVAAIMISGFAFITFLAFDKVGFSPKFTLFLGVIAIFLSAVSGWFYVFPASLRADCLAKLGSLTRRSES